MAAWTAATRQATNLARLSTPISAATSTQAANLIHRRALSGGGGNLHFFPFRNFNIVLKFLSNSTSILALGFVCFTLSTSVIECAFFLLGDIARILF